MKYNLNDLHWQQFEIFSFRCLQKLVSSGIQFLEGGNDKGRDIIYDGPSLQFQPSWNGRWIFQVKHKSLKGTDQSKNVTTICNDLNDELFKICIKERVEFDNYILVTNLIVNSSFQAKAQSTFIAFCEKNNISNKNFFIVGYNHFESCIDEYVNLKWIFPNILSHPDFELLIRSISDSIIQNRNIGWFNTISKYRKYFVYTNFYNEASSKLKDYHAILLSGPPKSGKTFNAEILVFNYFGQNAFDPLKIDAPEEIEQFYRKDIKQIFFCDDAFGSHSLSYINADDWNRKIEGILSLANETHKFIFTSREHVYKAFKNYATNFKGKYLEKIVVNNENLSLGEKSAILERYTLLSNLSQNIKQSIIKSEKSIINHKSFSPETIRSFFANLPGEKFSKYIIDQQLVSHLNKPDEYIRNLFLQLDENKRILLLGVLCSLNPQIQEIGKTYSNLCNDVGAKKLDSYKTVLEELDGGILKTNRNNDFLEVRYYHPTMKEGLIQIIKDDENGTIHNAVIKNLNLELLELCFFDSVKTKKNKAIGIKQSELDSFGLSIKRLINNDSLQSHQILRLLKWFTTDNSDSLIKVLDKPFYLMIKSVIFEFTGYLKTDDFWTKYKCESTSRWAEIVWYLKSLSLVYYIDLKSLFCTYWFDILDERKSDKDYWKFVLRISNFIDEDELKKRVGRAWLNDFYLNLKSQLNELGYEIFGSEFPDFPTYNSLSLADKNNIPKNQKLKYKPNRTWYPRFISCKEKVTYLKDLKGNKIGQQILIRIEKEYDELLKQSDYAFNRHTFNKEQEWW